MEDTKKQVKPLFQSIPDFSEIAKPLPELTCMEVQMFYFKMLLFKTASVITRVS